ncbi:MAG: hypothetical protein V7K86_14175 [Nostoc sp.]|uniref:hypothetical protein n=1 Tax=Nostoc sp. TaxID=1180 RepID=UPI002FF8C855
MIAGRGIYNCRSLHLESIKAEIDELIDAKLDKRLGEFERRLLAEFRQNDRQPAPEELIEDIPETRPDSRPDYQAVRDRILRSLRSKVASTSPQFKTATKVLDKFISELEADANPPLL